MKVKDIGWFLYSTQPKELPPPTLIYKFVKKNKLMEYRMLEKTVRSLNPNSSPLQEYGPQVLANICLFHYSKKQPIFCGKEIIVTGFFILTSTDLSFIGSSSTCQRPSGLVYVLILMKLFPCLFLPSPRSLWLFYMIQFPDHSTFRSPSLDVFVNMSLKCRIHS